MKQNFSQNWRLLEYRQRWSLTWRGWIMIGLIMVALFCIFVWRIHPFLAPQAPIEAEVLVVEGWLTDPALEGALAEFEQGNYQLLITTGQTLRKGFYLAEYKTYAQLAEATLLELGCDRNQLVAVPAPKRQRNRTYTSALTLAQWLAEADLNIKKINLYSEDVHTRRSWLLFQKALAPEIQVGAIAFHSVEYNPKLWWTSSEGVRSVLPEAIGYIYAKLFTIFGKKNPQSVNSEAKTRVHLPLLSTPEE